MTLPRGTTAVCSRTETFGGVVSSPPNTTASVMVTPATPHTPESLQLRASAMAVTVPMTVPFRTLARALGARAIRLKGSVYEPSCTRSEKETLCAGGLPDGEADCLRFVTPPCPTEEFIAPTNVTAPPGETTPS